MRTDDLRPSDNVEARGGSRGLPRSVERGGSAMKKQKVPPHRLRRKRKLSIEEQASVAEGDASEALTRIKKSEERIEMLEQILNGSPSLSMDLRRR